MANKVKTCCLRSVRRLWHRSCWLAVTLCFTAFLQEVRGGVDGWFRNLSHRRGHEIRFPDEDDPSAEEKFANLEREELMEQAQVYGWEALAEEAGDAKKAEYMDLVTRWCSVGAQTTMIMGCGALLLRLVPVLLGHEDEEEEEAEMQAPLLVESSAQDDRALLTRQQQQLLTDSSGQQAGSATVVRGVEADEAAFTEEAARNSGEILKSDRRSMAFRKARRISRPFLRTMAPPLALLLVTRTFIARRLIAGVDPEEELLFGDDILGKHASKKVLPSGIAGGFSPPDFSAQDAKSGPGRWKFGKRKSVQRMPKTEDDQGAGDSDAKADTDD